MGKGSGFGKVILFGEHFVVHSVPGIVSAIDSTVDAEVKKIGEGITVKDERKGARDYTQKKMSEQKQSIERMLRTMEIDPEKAILKIWLGGNLPGFSGIGASAASSVAIARALAEEFRMDLSDEKINEIAYEAEKAYAGTPSGIDNTAATYGGLIWFKRNLSGGPNMIEKLSIRDPVEIKFAIRELWLILRKWLLGLQQERKKIQENTICCSNKQKIWRSQRERHWKSLT